MTRWTDQSEAALENVYGPDLLGNKWVDKPIQDAVAFRLPSESVREAGAPASEDKGQRPTMQHPHLRWESTSLWPMNLTTMPVLRATVPS